MLRNVVQTLVVLAVALPLVAAVLVWVAGLLHAMGDAAGASVVGYVGTACQVAWSLSLVSLLVTLSLLVLDKQQPARGQDEIEEE